MKNFNFPMFILACVVVLMFSLVGVAVAFKNFLLIGLFLILGFVFMGYGIALKKRKSDA